MPEKSMPKASLVITRTPYSFLKFHSTPALFPQVKKAFQSLGMYEYRVENSVNRYWIHPKYDNTTAYYDVAVIEVDYEIEFNGGVQPICLPDYEENADSRAGHLVSIAGMSI